MTFPSEHVQRLMALLEEKARAGTWHWRIGSSALSWSAGLYKILGVDPTITPSFDLYTSLVHPDDRLDFGNPARIDEDGAFAHRQFRILRPNGVQRIIRSFGQVLHTPAGAPQQIVGVALDITDSWRETVALRRQFGLLDALDNLTDIDVWQTGARGSLTDAVEWLGTRRPQKYSSAELAGVGEVHPDDQSIVSECWRQAIADQRHYSASYRVRSAGSYVKVVSHGTAIRGPTGLIEGWVGVTAPAAPLPSNDLETGEPLTPSLIRASRGMLDWRLSDLARESRLSMSTVRRAEQETSRHKMAESLVLIRACFERQGLKFLRLGKDLGVLHTSTKSYPVSP